MGDEEVEEGEREEEEEAEAVPEAAAEGHRGG